MVETHALIILASAGTPCKRLLRFRESEPEDNNRLN